MYVYVYIYMYVHITIYCIIIIFMFILCTYVAYIDVINLFVRKYCNINIIVYWTITLANIISDNDVETLEYVPI